MTKTEGQKQSDKYRGTETELQRLRDRNRLTKTEEQKQSDKDRGTGTE